MLRLCVLCTCILWGCIVIVLYVVLQTLCVVLQTYIPHTHTAHSRTHTHTHTRSTHTHVATMRHHTYTIIVLCIKSVSQEYCVWRCRGRARLEHTRALFHTRTLTRAHTHTHIHMNARTHAHTHTTQRHVHAHGAQPCIQPRGSATHCNALQRTATRCNTLQHTATHCNTLQHTATHCNTLQPSFHTLSHLKHNHAYKTLGMPCIFMIHTSHIQMRHVAHIHESRPTYGSGMSKEKEKKSRFPRMIESHHTSGYITSQTWMSHTWRKWMHTHLKIIFES